MSLNPHTYKFVDAKPSKLHILNPKTQQQMHTEYTALEQKLGGSGASQKVAKAVYKVLC